MSNLIGSPLEHHGGSNRHERSETIRQLHRYRLRLCQGVVEGGEYRNMIAAVSGELAKAKVERERAMLETELERRLSLPIDQ